MDTVFIKQLIVPTLIGVFPEERKAPQNLLIDLEMSTDVRPAAEDDDLTKTIDYAAVRESIMQFAADSSFELVETFAERLAQHLNQHFHFPAIRLSITKKPFDITDAAGVGVIIERHFG